jgi:hypothetical protein
MSCGSTASNFFLGLGLSKIPFLATLVAMYKWLYWVYEN